MDSRYNQIPSSLVGRPINRKDITEVLPADMRSSGHYVRLPETRAEVRAPAREDKPHRTRGNKSSSEKGILNLARTEPKRKSEKW